MLTETLAKFTAEIEFDQIPQDVVERAKYHILDTLGAMVAGAAQPVSQLIIQYVKALGGNPQSSIIAAGFKTSAPHAALANGTMGHALDFDDDSDTTVSHPSVSILSAALALGEGCASGRDLLTAYVAAEEVMARIASVPGLMPDHYEKGWHATATIGVLGAAVAAAKIINLEVEQVRIAMGIAASEASGLQANFGTMVKPLHAGSAATKGVRAALLAEAGFVGNRNILEEKYGFLRLFGVTTDFDTRTITADLGQRFDLVSPGINIKKYPCCYYTQTAIDALLHLLDEHGLESNEIEKIRCGLSKIAIQVLEYSEPTNGAEGKFCFPYCLAVALVKRGVQIEDFTDEKINQIPFRHLMRIVEMYTHPDLNEDGKTLGVVLEVETKDGQKYVKQMEVPIGHSRSPLGWDAVCRKFRSCVRKEFNDREAVRIEETVEQLEKISAIKPMMDILAKIRKPH